MARVTTMPDEVSFDPAVESIEPRIRRLEQAVAALGDTQLMEDRVVERVVRRIEPPTNGSGVFAGASRLFKGRAQPLKPVEAEHETAAPPEPAPAPPAVPSRSGWLIPEFIQEVRWMSRMCTDYRYRLSWPGWVVPIACIVIGILSWFLIGGLPVIGGIADRIVNILLVVIVYKSLSREVQRYRISRGLR